MSEENSAIKTWLKITNTAVISKIKEIKNINGISYPAVINQLLFKAIKYDENNFSTYSNSSTNENKILNEINSLFVQIVKSKDEIINKINSKKNLNNNSSEYKIFKIFVMDKDEENLKNITHYLSKYNYKFEYNFSSDDQNYFCSSDEDKKETKQYNIGTLIIHDSNGISFKPSSDLNHLINKIYSNNE